MTLQELLRTLNLHAFVAFDFETTGLDHSKDKIIECAAIRFVNGIVEDSFSCLINPGFLLPYTISHLTGITDTMLRDAPEEASVLPAFLKFIGHDPLVAHNIEFDYGFLKAAKSTYLAQHSQETNPEITNILYDTMTLSQTFLFFLPNHRLETVTRFLGLSTDPDSLHRNHRALPDTENAGQIFIRLIQEMASYPLEIIQKCVSIFQKFNSRRDQRLIPNKDLFFQMAEALTQNKCFENGLFPSAIPREVRSNIFSFVGSKKDFSKSAKEIFGEEIKMSYPQAESLTKDISVLLKEKSKISEPSFGEIRSGQTEYSEFVSRVFSEGAIGVVEAGTGLGKSLAYLYSSLKCALEEKKGPIIISCHTKHLQDQLFYQEIPKIARVLQVSFRATLMKGKQNYLCKTRLNWVLSDLENLLSPYDAMSLLPVIIWMSHTKTGDISECPGFLNRGASRLKDLILSDVGFCTTRICHKNGGCYVGPLREANQSADIIIINHSLLLSESIGCGILPPFDCVVIDEAHNLVKAAYHQFQIQFNRQMIREALRLLDPKTKAGKRLKDQITLTQSSPKDHSENSDVHQLFDHLQDLINPIYALNENFFQLLSDHRKSKSQPEGSSRKNSQNFVEKIPYHNFEEEFEREFRIIDELLHALDDFKNVLSRLLSILKQGDEHPTKPELVSVCEGAYDASTEILNRILTTTLEEKKDWVYWFEGQVPSTRSGQVLKNEVALSLNGVAVDVGSFLKEKLFDGAESVVLTSATLSTGENFDYFLFRSGIKSICEKPVITASFPSPYLYQEQCLYFQWAGDIDPNSKEFHEFIVEVMKYLHQKWRKRMMVLFTSLSSIETCYHILEEEGLLRNLNVFSQFFQTSKNSLLEGFRNSQEGILMGTASFWEGIDLPQDLLEILVITKLPFDVPTEPLIRAYAERIDNHGGNSFLEFMVPEAVIRLRQGFGRLIRSSHDQGIFINLDNRVVTKQYGPIFQQSIPVPMRMFTSLDEL